MADPHDLFPADTEITDSGFRRRREATVGAVREALRNLLRDSGRTQRSVEDDNGFRRGYLSQVLQGHITLTARHLIGILQSLEVAPSAFFARLEEPWETPAPVLSEIRQRMAVFDQALAQLSSRGLIEIPTLEVVAGVLPAEDDDDD